MAATGVLKGKQRRALDSTVLDDAAVTQDTDTRIISAIRRVVTDALGLLGHLPEREPGE